MRQSPCFLHQSATATAASAAGVAVAVAGVLAAVIRIIAEDKEEDDGDDYDPDCVFIVENVH